MSVPFKKKPAWLASAGLLAVELPEPHYHAKYNGSSSAGAEAAGDEARSDAALDALAQAGVQLLCVPFYRGYGLEFEKEELERARELVPRAQARGLRVAARVTLGAVIPETLVAEESDARNWLQVNQDGQPALYGAAAAGTRVRPCYQSEGYQRHMEKVCALAVESGADLVLLEDVAYNPEPDTCRCPLCVSGFREMLREQYGPQDEATRAAGLARFGHQDFAHVRPPMYREERDAAAFPVLEGPHEQEWLRFKVRTLVRCVARLSHLMERKRPECAVAADVLRPAGTHAEWDGGLACVEMLPRLDAAGVPANAAGETAPDSWVRALQTARAFEVAVIARADTEQLLAATLAFHPTGGICIVGGGGEGKTLDTFAREYQEFQRGHRETLLQGARSLARVAVYHDPASLAFGGAAPHASLAFVERMLLEHQIAFDAVFPDHLDRLSSYRAVVLPDAECLSDETAGKLRTYVEAGGGVVITERTGACDPWRRARPRPVLSDLLDGKAEPSQEHATEGSRVSRYGQGRAAYVAGPRDELLEVLTMVAGEPPCRAAASSGRFLVQPWALTPAGLAVHVLSLDWETPVRGLEVSLACSRPPREGVPLSPVRTGEPLFFDYDASRERMHFRCTDVKGYVVFRVQ